MATMVKSFQELTPEMHKLAGGKGAMLSSMYREGYPVPPGLILLYSAFTNGAESKAEAWDEAQALLDNIRKRHRDAQFAVRSSAQASFAGEYETALNVQSDEAVLRAIHTVANSAKSNHVRSYSQAQGLSGAHQMAVVIQMMVQPELPGVLFTVNPVTGSYREMTGNYVNGLGERLVSGDSNAREFSFTRPSGTYQGSSELQRHAGALYKYARRLEKSLGMPQDIEWAISRGKLYLLQTRPITTLTPGNVANYEVNDSMVGDDLWVNTNVGEAVPDVVTPYTWSLIRYLDEHTTFATGYYVWSGNICGRIYSNYGRRISAYVAMGFSMKSALQTSGSFFGRLPMPSPGIHDW